MIQIDRWQRKKIFRGLNFIFKKNWLMLADPTFRDVVQYHRILPADSRRIEKLLRSMLRLNPDWLVGHYLLGASSFSLMQSDTNQRKQHLLGQIQASAEVCESHDLEKEALVLRLAVAIYTRNFDQASDVFSKLGHTVEMHGNLSVFLAEMQTAVLLVLEKRELAKSLVAQIPEHLMTPELSLVSSLDSVSSI